MSIFKVSSSDIKVLVFIRPPFTVLLCYVLFGSSFFNDINVFIPAATVAFLMVITTWRLHIYADYFLRKRFFNYQHTAKRITLSVLFHYLMALVIFNSFLFWANSAHFMGFTYTLSNYLLSLLVVFCTNLAATGFHEGVYMFKNWKKTLVEAEELKRLTLKNRLSGLRNQTNPHFFFNSINTLSGLIEENPEKADVFLNEMCIVYRYLLKNDEGAFLPLSKEMAFIQSWMHIVETRYGKAVKFMVNWRQPSQDKSISRLALLSFLENILETYIISRKDCFLIVLNINNENLEIIHPVKQKKLKVPIRSQEQVEEVKAIHRLLGMPEITEYENGREKTIVIPLYPNNISDDSL